MKHTFRKHHLHLPKAKRVYAASQLTLATKFKQRCCFVFLTSVGRKQLGDRKQGLRLWFWDAEPCIFLCEEVLQVQDEVKHYSSILKITGAHNASGGNNSKHHKFYGSDEAARLQVTPRELALWNRYHQNLSRLRIFLRKMFSKHQSPARPTSRLRRVPHTPPSAIGTARGHTRRHQSQRVNHALWTHGGESAGARLENFPLLG